MSKQTKGMLGEEKSLPYGSIVSQVGFLEGKVLTIIDASIEDERQLKAIKDLIKSAFNSQLSWVAQLCFPETRMTTREALQAEGVDVEAIERGAVEGSREA